jgi:biopolymer transport protein ExbD
MSRRKPIRSGELGFELNLAPIIDCFTVLITYLLVSAAFVSLGAFEVSVPAVTSAEAAPGSVPPSVQLTVRLRADRALSLELSGAETRATGIRVQDLASGIRQVKERWPALASATLIAEDDAPYEDVVTAVEAVKREIASVYFSESEAAGRGE